MTRWYFHQHFACGKSNSHVLTTHLHPFISFIWFILEFYWSHVLFFWKYVCLYIFCLLLTYGISSLWKKLRLILKWMRSSRIFFFWIFKWDSKTLFTARKSSETSLNLCYTIFDYFHTIYIYYWILYKYTLIRSRINLIVILFSHGKELWMQNNTWIVGSTKWHVYN